jgi:TatD DNase family protein
MLFIDTHAHFDSCIKNAGYSEDFLLSEMARAGVGYAVQISTEKDDMEWCESFARAHSNIWYTLGVHPESEFGDDKIDFLDAMVLRGVSAEGDRKIFGIGEIGLDYYWNSENKREQIDFFEKQIAVAKKHSLPVIIHSRDAFDDMYDVLSRAQIGKGILHCFSGNEHWAKRFLDLGFHVSFAGNVTYKKSADLQSAAVYVPSDRLLLETDCPYLSPQPVRGTKNHPAFVVHTYEHVAVLRGVPLDELCGQIADNFFTFVRP